MVSGETLTAGQLAEFFSSLPPEMPVIASYDAGCAWGDIIEVKTEPRHLGTTPAVPQDTAVLVVY